MDRALETSFVADETGIDKTDAGIVHKQLDPANPAAHGVEIRAKLLHWCFDTLIPFSALRFLWALLLFAPHDAGHQVAVSADAGGVDRQHRVLQLRRRADGVQDIET